MLLCFLHCGRPHWRATEHPHWLWGPETRSDWSAAQGPGAGSVSRPGRSHSPQAGWRSRLRTTVMNVRASGGLPHVRGGGTSCAWVPASLAPSARECGLNAAGPAPAHLRRTWPCGCSRTCDGSMPVNPSRGTFRSGARLAVSVCLYHRDKPGRSEDDSGFFFDMI